MLSKIKGTIADKTINKAALVKEISMPNMGSVMGIRTLILNCSMGECIAAPSAAIKERGINCEKIIANMKKNLLDLTFR